MLLAVVGISVAANAQVGNQNYKQNQKTEKQNQKTEKQGNVCKTTTTKIDGSVYGNGVSQTKTTETCKDTKTITTNTCTTVGFKGGIGPVKGEATQTDCTKETKIYKKDKTEGGTRERWVRTE